MGTQFKTPVTVYVVHHPQCEEAETLVGKLYDWFRVVESFHKDATLLSFQEIWQ